MSDKFDFDSFKQNYNGAVEGLSDTIKAVKNIISTVQEVAKQIGAEKLVKTTNSFINVTEEQISCFNSVEASAEEVKFAYEKFDVSVN